MPHANGLAPIALVYNPTKVNKRILLQTFQEKCEALSRTALLFETSETDAGQNATQQALAQGAQLVIAAGGDGTVRAVAEALRGQDIPLALVPSGTGNLLARNLGLPLNSLGRALDIALKGQVQRIDLGVVQITRVPHADDSESHSTHDSPTQEHPIVDEDAYPSTEQIATIDIESVHTSEHVFLVLAGIGLDAHMIQNTHPGLKKSMGWIAYFIGGIRSLLTSERKRISFIVSTKKKRSHRVHSIMVANCGQLPGGIRFLPEAKIDDGLFDIVVLRPQGFVGWVQVTWQMLWQNGIRRRNSAGKKIQENDSTKRTLIYLTGDSIKLLPNVPMPIELDGDEFGIVERMHCWVEPAGLAVVTEA